MATVTARSAGLEAQATFTVAPAAMLFGANTNQPAGIAAAEKVLGPLAANRIFYSGALPTSYAQLGLPARTQAWVSYKTASANTAPFVKSCPAGTVVIYHHEPENDYGGNGAQFVTEFSAQSDLIRAANPAVRVGMAAMTYQYAFGEKWGATGSYLPPSSKVDLYACDDYLNKPTVGGAGLAVKADFQAWYQLVKDRGKPLAFAEYGRGVNPVGYTTDQWMTARPSVMATDRAWLEQHPGFVALLYWWNTGAQGDWRFHDPASVAAWTAMQA